MTIDEDARFDAAVENLRESADRAREQWVLAAQAYRIMRGRDDWPATQPVAELTVYLTSLDYELKVLLHRFHEDVNNRAVWERLLALEVYEAVEAVPKRLGMVIRSADPRSERFRMFREANAMFASTVRDMKKDEAVWALIKRTRNEITAHHGSKGDDPMLTHVAWALASEENRARGLHTHRSKVAGFAVEVGSTVQRIGELIAANR